MKKVIVVTILMGLSGTALVAPEVVMAAAPNGSQFSEEQIRKLPPALQEILQKLRSGKLENLPPYPDLKTFVDASETQIRELQTKLTALLAKKGYLIGTEFDQYAQKALAESKSHINALKGLQALIGPAEGSIAYDRAQIPLFIELLEDVPPPDTFPGKCYNYGTQGGRVITGFVQRVFGNLVFQYGGGEEEFYKFINPISDVGLINSGKEYNVSITPNGMQQDAWVGPDNKVACLSFVHKASTPSNLPGKKSLPKSDLSKRPGVPAK